MTVRAGDTSDDGYRAALKVLADSTMRPTALLCCNDMVAIGCYRAAHELGLHIPNDISIVGFDGIDMGEVMPESARKELVFALFDAERGAGRLMGDAMGSNR